jgi:hypothetical protein
MSKGTDRNVGILKGMERGNCSGVGKRTEENREGKVLCDASLVACCRRMLASVASE